MRKQAMELALDALKDVQDFKPNDKTAHAIAALKEAIKQQGAPVAWYDHKDIYLKGSITFDKHEAERWPRIYPDALYPSAPTIPEGMVLVPKEPTAAMCDAFHKAVKIHLEYGEDVYVENEDLAYKAMLSAAPKGEQP